MKWVESEAQARELRDMAIECMVLVGRIIWLFRSTGDDLFNRRHRRACAMYAGEVVDIINRTTFDLPALKPSEEEWKRVASARVGEFDQSDDVEVLSARLGEREHELRAIRPQIFGSDVAAYERYRDAWQQALAEWRHRATR